MWLIVGVFKKWVSSLSVCKKQKSCLPHIYCVLNWFFLSRYLYCTLHVNWLPKTNGENRWVASCIVVSALRLLNDRIPSRYLFLWYHKRGIWSVFLHANSHSSFSFFNLGAIFSPLSGMRGDIQVLVANICRSRLTFPLISSLVLVSFPPATKP